MRIRLSRSELAWLALLAAALLAVYLPGLGNALVFDDDYLADGRLFSQYKDLGTLRPRMLSYGTFVWVQQLFGDGWWKQRLVNLAFHVATVIALWGLYREILRSITPGSAPATGDATSTLRYEQSPALGIAIAAFALNPAAVYAVGYLVQRSIVMATFFGVVALWLFARGLRTGRNWHYAAAVLAYVAAVASKEHALLVPLAALPLYVLVARPSRKRLLAVAGAVVALAALAGAVLWRQYGAIIATPFDEFSKIYLAQLSALEPSAPQRAYGLSVLNQAWLFFEYGVRWMLPWTGWMSISMRPPFPLTWTTFPHVLGVAGYLAVLAGGAWLLLRHRDWRALIGLSLLMPALLFATEFATVWVQDPFVLYRSYLWAIGIPGLVFCLVHGPSPKVLLAVGLAFGGFLAWQALDRILSLETPERVWSDAIAKLPKDPRAVGRWFPYLNRGSAYAERDEFDLALRDFDASTALGDMGIGLFNAGSILASRGQHAEALKLFERAQAAGYSENPLAVQRGLSYAATGQLQAAYGNFRAARHAGMQSPTREVVLLGLARAALQLEKRDEAIDALQELLETEPRHKEARYLLGMAYVTRGDHEKAHALLSQLLADDAAAPGYYARALANYGMKRKAEALSDIQDAIRRDPRNPMLREWEAKISAMPGNRAVPGKP
jgi:protein O-mannosyl-transferase